MCVVYSLNILLQKILIHITHQSRIQTLCQVECTQDKPTSYSYHRRRQLRHILTQFNDRTRERMLQQYMILASQTMTGIKQRTASNIMIGSR